MKWDLFSTLLKWCQPTNFGSLSQVTYMHAPCDNGQHCTLFATSRRRSTGGHCQHLCSDSEPLSKTFSKHCSYSEHVCNVQVGKKLLVATAGGSSQKPSAIALLEVGSVDELVKSEPEQWQSMRLSTKSEVSTDLYHYISNIAHSVTYIELHRSTSYYITSHHIAWHYITLHHIALHRIELHLLHSQLCLLFAFNWNVWN